MSNESSQAECEICEIVLPSKNEYYVHANETHPNNVAKYWYECGHCKLFFPTLDIRDLHRAELHTAVRKPSARVAAKRKGTLSTKCQHCDVIFENHSDITKHFNEFHPEHSSTKRQYTPRVKRDNTLRYQQVEVESEEGFLKCPFCEEIFAELSDFATHTNETHKEEVGGWLQCQLCNDHLPNAVLLDKHKLECQLVGNESRICEFCSEVFDDEIVFVQHSNKSHHNQIKDIWIQCDYCRLLLPNNETLDDHRLVSHKGKAAKIKCSFCNQLFIDTSSYLTHASKQHSDEIIKEGWHSCPECELFFPSLESLKKHKHDLTTDSNKSVLSDTCGFCSKSFSKAFILYNHINMDHREEVESTWISCDECEKLWPSDEVLEQHKARAHRKRYSARGKRMKSCNYCDKSFCDSSEFYRHANTFHRDELIADEWIPCTLCGTMFPDLAVIKNHKIKAHPSMDLGDESKKRDRSKRLAHCQFCDKNLCDTTELYRHANHFHRDQLDNWLSCDLCDMMFPDEIVIRNHKGRVHPGSVEPRKYVPKAKEVPDESKLFDCKFCTEVKVASQQAFYRHANKDHMDLIIDTWPLCEPCDLRFPSTLILDRHNIKVHKMGSSLNILCNYCTKTFPRYQHLVAHSNRYHKLEISTIWGQCETCNTFFPTNELLRHHLLRAHTAKKSPSEKMQCPFCPALLSTLASFYAHTNDRHTERLVAGEGDWAQCNHCALFFPTKDILNNHINHRHNEEKTGPKGKTKTCTFCKLKFNHPMLVYAHIAEVHRELVENDWHYCDKCEIFFPTKLGLTFHMLRSKHRSLKAKDTCPFCSNTFKGKGKMYRHANRLHKDLLPQHWVLCTVCNSYMPDEVILSSHMINAHGRNFKGRQKTPSTPSKTTATTTSTSLSKCTFCQRILSSTEEYYRHATKAHQEEVIKDWKPCDKCDLYLPTKKSLRIHAQKEHLEPIPEMLLITEVPPPIHEEQIELETSEIVVEIDDSVQTDEILHCSICSETFFKPQLFYKHSNQMHLENIVDSWLMCTSCKMYYPGMAVLKAHAATAHTQIAFGSMRITCTICLEAFDRTGDFYWHANQHHTDTVAKDWFLCEKCNFFFPEWDTLEQHKAYFHPNDQK